MFVSIATLDISNQEGYSLYLFLDGNYPQSRKNMYLNKPWKIYKEKMIFLIS